MGVFDGIGNAPMPNSGLYFKDGTYLVEIMACRHGTSRKPGAGDYCVVEATVLEVLVGYGEDEKESNAVGERVSWVVMMKHGETSLSNLKGFIAAAISSDEDEIIDPDIVDSDMAEKVFASDDGEEEMLRGVQLKAIATTVQTKAGNDFTKVVWYAPFTDTDDD